MYEFGLIVLGIIIGLGAVAAYFAFGAYVINSDNRRHPLPPSKEAQRKARRQAAMLKS